MYIYPIKNNMKKVILIAIAVFALSSCGSGNYIPCPAYSSNEWQETEGIHEDLSEEELQVLISE